MTRTLDQKVARLLTVGTESAQLDNELSGLLDRGVGGVILFKRNLKTPRQVAELCRSIKRHAGRPVHVAVDQEGGRVARLVEGFTRFAPMRQLGATRDMKLAFEVGRAMGRELRAVGIDVDFAPVLDVDTNPQNPVIGDRALSSDTAAVARMGVSLLRGLQDAGVAACGKHFPGHGDTVLDSHLALPRLVHAPERLQAIELVPFRAAVQAKVASLMTAHVVYEALDPDYPATMSVPVVRGLLREELGYAGVVFSDDVHMSAIWEHYGHQNMIVRGALASVDSFLVCHSAQAAHEMIDALVDAVEVGEVPRDLIEASGRRLDELARRYVRPASEPALDLLRSPEHLELARRFEAPPATSAETDDPTLAVLPSGAQRPHNDPET